MYIYIYKLDPELRDMYMLGEHNIYIKGLTY